VVRVTDPYSRMFSVLETGAVTSLSSSSSVVLTGLSGPRSRPTACFFQVVPRIERGPPDLEPRTLTARPQRRSQNTVLYVKIDPNVLLSIIAFTLRIQEESNSNFGPRSNDSNSSFEWFLRKY
jgi:hypothetical protein